MSLRGGSGRSVRWGPWFVPLIVCTVLTQTTQNIARPLVSYRVLAVGGDALAVGLVAATFAVLPLVIAMPLGRISDRLAKLGPVLVAGAALFVAGALLLSFATTIPTLAAASAVLGLGQLTALVAGQATVARWSDSDQMDRGFGWFTAAASAGQLAGPLVAGFLLGDRSGAALAEASREAFLVAAAASVLAVPFALLVMVRTPPRRPSAAERRAVGDARLLPLPQRPRVPTWLFASLALLGAADILTAYLPVLGENRGIPPAVVGVLLALRAGATICSRLMLHQLLRRWSHEGLVVASAAGSALAIAVVPLPFSGVPLMALALLVGGFLLGIGQPLTMGLVVRAVPAQWSSSGLALRLVANRLGQVALPATAGLLAGSGAGALWLACGVLGAASATSRRVSRRE